MMHRRALLGLMATAWACRRSRAPVVAEVTDQPPAPGRAEALANLAPPWTAPTRTRLSNGLVSFWLREPETPGAHLRVCMPLADADGPISAAAAAAIAEHVRFELARRVDRAPLSVDLRSGVQRLEVALHGPGEAMPAALRALGQVLRPRPVAAAVERARDRVAERVGSTTSDEIALAGLTAALSDTPITTHRLVSREIAEVSRAELERAFHTMTDPRNAVLVVHAADEASTVASDVRRMEESWRGTGRADAERGALDRLRVPLPSLLGKGGGGRLLADPPVALQILAGGVGGGVLWLGRVVPTPTAADRSALRLAQRVAQETIDARLVLAGSQALFVVRAPLAGAADDRATSAIDRLSAAVNARHPAQRLFQAAQLWLGARVVQASMEGEDWTALWSAAMDLADRDRDIANALARDAATMLEPDPEALRTFARRWLDPRAGEPGWHWVAAGTDASVEQRLQRIAPLKYPG